jgi:hypothetical protein
MQHLRFPGAHRCQPDGTSGSEAIEPGSLPHREP